MASNGYLKILLMTLVFAGLAACNGGGSGGGSGNDNGDPGGSPGLAGWTDLGTLGTVDNTYTAHSMVIDGNGDPVVAREDQDNKLHVQRWDSAGEAWQSVGDLGVEGYGPALAVDSANNPLLVYWAEPAGKDYYTAYAVRWTGTSWEALGGADDLVNRSNAFSKSGNFADVEFDANGKPIVAVPRVNNAYDEIIVRRWDGGTWQDVGSSPQVTGNQGTRYASLAVGTGGDLLLAWAEMPQDINGFDTSEANGYVAEFDGGTADWKQLDSGNATPEEVANADNDGFASIREPHAMFETDGTPVIAWYYRSIHQVGPATYLRRWDKNQVEWVDHAADRLDGTTSPAVALVSSNLPMVAFDNNAIDRKVALHRWESSLWKELGDPLPGERASLSVSGDDTLYVGVQDRLSPNELHIYRYTP